MCIRWTRKGLNIILFRIRTAGNVPRKQANKLFKAMVMFYTIRMSPFSCQCTPSHQNTALSTHLSNNALPHLLHQSNMNVDTFYPIHCLPVSPKWSEPHTTSRCAMVCLWLTISCAVLATTLAAVTIPVLTRSVSDSPFPAQSWPPPWLQSPFVSRHGLSLTHHFLRNPSHLLGCSHHSCLVIHKAHLPGFWVCWQTVTALSNARHGTSDGVQNARHNTRLCSKVFQCLAYIMQCITCCIYRLINIRMDVYCL